jgi:hypothetical protein
MPRWHWREHGLEANGQEDNLLMRVRAGDGQRFGGRVHHADVGAAGLGAQQVGAGAGHAQHVAVGNQDHIGL